MGCEGEAYVARGTVRERRDGPGRPDLWVEAFDLDRLERADRLGVALTDAEGAFSIEFRKASFARSLSEALAKPGPNLLITVREEDGALLHMTAPRASAARLEEFEIILDEAGQADRQAFGVAHSGEAGDPTAHWASRIGLPAGTSTHALRREVRNLGDERLRRLDHAERQGLRSFVSLTTAFRPKVAWAFTRSGARDLATLRDWPEARARNALAVAGVADEDVEVEARRLQRLRALWPEERPEDVVSGIDIDIQDRSALSRADWEELRRRDVCTLEDWRDQRDDMAVSGEGRAALDCYFRLMSLGVPVELVDRFRRQGLVGARALAELKERELAPAAIALRIPEAELASIVATARDRIAALEDAIIGIVRADKVGAWEWIEQSAGVGLRPAAASFPNEIVSERFGYLAYLRQRLDDIADAPDSWAHRLLVEGPARALEPVARVVVWNEALDRARAKPLDDEASFTWRWRLLQARLQIARMSSVDLSGGDSNLELRLRAGLVAPFAPASRFTPAELAMLERRADQAARRQVRQQLQADPAFAEAAGDHLDGQVEQRLARLMAPAVLEAELLRNGALRRLDGRDDDAIRADCLIDPALPADETTTRLDEAVLALTMLLGRYGGGDRTLRFGEWREQRRRLLWPHIDPLAAEGCAGSEGEPDLLGKDTTPFLLAADRLVRAADAHPDAASPEVGSLLAGAEREIASAIAEGSAGPALKLVRARLARALLRRGIALAGDELPEARTEAAACCRAVLELHGDASFAGRLCTSETTALLWGMIGQSTSRARRESDMADLVSSVDRVVRALSAARTAGASGAEIARVCRAQVPAPGMAPSELTLRRLGDALEALRRVVPPATESIRTRYARLVDLAEIRMPTEEKPGITRRRDHQGTSPLELLLAAPMPTRDPAADCQKLAAVLLLEEIRADAAMDDPPVSTGAECLDKAAASAVVRDAVLRLSRCSMFARHFDQLLSASAALHERAVSTTARLRAEAGLPHAPDQAAFERRSQEWVDLVATAPECLSHASRSLRTGLQLVERESLAIIARNSAGLALPDIERRRPESCLTGIEDGLVSAVARPAVGPHGTSAPEGPWHLVKRLSFARLMPGDLQAFREGSAILAFRMLSQWFDEEFPNHCERRIEGIGIALTVSGGAPVMAGIRLWSSGTAFILSGPGPEVRFKGGLPRLASLAALAVPGDPSRLETAVDRTSFVGVELGSDWGLEISDGAGSIDPATFVDVEMLVEYSADGDYGRERRRQPRHLPPDHERLFSLRNEFPEAWHAVLQGGDGLFPVTLSDFGGRIDELAIVNLSLHLVTASGTPEAAAYLRLSSFAPADRTTVEGRVELADGIASTRQSVGHGGHPWAHFIGVAPTGEWQVALEPGGAAREHGIEGLMDLVLAIAYSGVPRGRQD